MLSDGEKVLACAEHLRKFRTTFLKADTDQMSEASLDYSRTVQGLQDTFGVLATNRAIEHMADWLDDAKDEHMRQFALATSWKFLSACSEIYGRDA